MRDQDAKPILPPGQKMPGRSRGVNHAGRLWHHEFAGAFGAVMNRIDPRVSGLVPGPAPSPRTAGSGAAFALPTSRSESVRGGAGTTRSAAVAFAAPLDTLVALQAMDQSADRKKRQTRRGRDLLDGLDHLKGALLAGRASISDLDRLRGTLNIQRESTDDPRLDDVLAHIELRAAVELAKLSRRA